VKVVFVHLVSPRARSVGKVVRPFRMAMPLGLFNPTCDGRADVLGRVLQASAAIAMAAMVREPLEHVPLTTSEGFF
jgi:hypothetical protein